MFTFPALVYALPLAGAVILIHLINMFRHRRVEWAALEFLLAGFKKSRTRILLQQLLLMLMRTLAVIAIILMLAQPKLQGPLAEFLGGGRANHHIILIDDSYSMGDHTVGQTAFDDAVGVVNRIIDNAVKNSPNDRVTLIPSSIARNIQGENQNEKLPVIREVQLDSEGAKRVRDYLKTIGCSESDTGPEAAFTAARSVLFASALSHRTVVYYISDFRTKDWQNTASILKTIEELKTKDAAIRMVRTVDAHRGNLAIRNVKMIDGIHAVDVPVLFEVTVVNFGPDPVDNAQISVRIDNTPQQGQSVPLIPAGGELTVPLQIRIPSPGPHRVKLQLDPDTIACDNVHSMVLDFPESLSVLIIAPEHEPGPGPRMFRNAISPSGIRTGVRVQVESPRYIAASPLDRFDVIVFSEVPKLDPSVVRNLEGFVAKGGGVAFFAGDLPNTDPRFINESLYKNGDGVFPVPTLAPAELPLDYLRNIPDLNAGNHPIFRLFEDAGSPLLSALRFEKYMTVDSSFETPGGTNTPSGSNVIARLRNGAPLVVEKTYGKGKSIAFLTSIDPSWNNWGRNPSYVITMLATVSHLARERNASPSLVLGSPLEATFDPEKYALKVSFEYPDDATRPNTDISYDREPEALLDTEGTARVSFPGADVSGFYEMVLTQLDGTKETRQFAVNVNPEEGNLAILDPLNLADMLAAHEVGVESHTGFSPPFEFVGAQSLTDSLLIILLLLLAGEMLLAGRILPPQK